MRLPASASCLGWHLRPAGRCPKQSEDLVRYLLREFEENPTKIWESNIFVKSLHELVNEGLHNKLSRMPDDFDGIVYDIGFGMFDHHQEPREYRANGVPYAEMCIRDRSCWSMAALMY